MTPDKALIQVLGFGMREFLRKAIRGGWEHQHPYPNDEEYWDEFTLAYMLLDKNAWLAVGKVENWGELCTEKNETCAYSIRRDMTCPLHPQWKYYTHRFLDTLWEEPTN